MSDSASSERKRVLDPVDRIIEAIFGLVMVLTFTCTLSTVESTRADVRSMMLAAIGCNVAWGIVDGVMYFFARVSQRMRDRQVLKVARSSEPAEAADVIVKTLPTMVAEALEPRGIEDLRLRLKALPEPPAQAFSRDDVLGSIGIFLIAVVSTIPVLLPFALMHEVHPAMRVSNAIALVLLFALGQKWASLIGLPRWRVGIAMALGGAVLVAVTIALGG